MSLKKLSAEFEKYVPKGIVNATANVLSAPARMRASRTIKQSGEDALAIKKARKYKGVPSFDAYDNPMKEAIYYRNKGVEAEQRTKSRTANILKGVKKITLPRMRVGRQLPK